MVKRQAPDDYEFQNKMMFQLPPNHQSLWHQSLTTPNPTTISPNQNGSEFIFPPAIPEIVIDPNQPWNMEPDDKDDILEENINCVEHTNTSYYPEPPTEDKMIPITDPLNQTTYYIGENKLSELIRQHGSLIGNNSYYHQQTHQLSMCSLKQQKQTIIEKFCNAKTLANCTESDVRELINLKVNITPVTNRDVHGLEKHQEVHHHHNQAAPCNMPFKCVICAVIDPAAQPKYLGNKENLKRHYHRHLEYKRFQCQICQMGFFRKDNTRRHVAKEHKKSDPERYVHERVSTC